MLATFLLVGAGLGMVFLIGRVSGEKGMTLEDWQSQQRNKTIPPASNVYDHYRYL
jgi:hypothetical protein